MTPSRVMKVKMATSLMSLWLNLVTFRREAKTARGDATACAAHNQSKSAPADTTRAWIRTRTSGPRAAEVDVAQKPQMGHPQL